MFLHNIPFNFDVSDRSASHALENLFKKHTKGE
jgi:hypothetical protein